MLLCGAVAGWLQSPSHAASVYDRSFVRQVSDCTPMFGSSVRFQIHPCKNMQYGMNRCIGVANQMKHKVRKQYHVGLRACGASGLTWCRRAVNHSNSTLAMLETQIASVCWSTLIAQGIRTILVLSIWCFICTMRVVANNCLL